MHACMHTCTHAYMHTCIHACIHAYMHTCIHAYIHTYVHTSNDLQTAVDLLDGALERLEELKPTCVDSGIQGQAHR